MVWTIFIVLLCAIVLLPLATSTNDNLTAGVMPYTVLLFVIQYIILAIVTTIDASISPKSIEKARQGFFASVGFAFVLSLIGFWFIFSNWETLGYGGLAIIGLLFVIGSVVSLAAYAIARAASRRR